MDDHPGIRIRFSERADGDLAVGGDVAERRRRLSDLPWTWLEQVHGSEVVVVAEPGHRCGAAADAVVSAAPGAVLAVHTADCAPVLLWGDAAGGPVVAAVHAGWRGLYDGVVERTVGAMRRLGADRLRWRLGPCIGPGAYEFGEADLTTMALRFGPEVVAATAAGRPALDLAAAVWSALRGADVEVAAPERPPCTATALDPAGRPRFFSWRARRDVGRQASLIWIEP